MSGTRTWLVQALRASNKALARLTMAWSQNSWEEDDAVNESYFTSVPAWMNF